MEMNKKQCDDTSEEKNNKKEKKTSLDIQERGKIIKKKRCAVTSFLCSVQ